MLTTPLGRLAGLHEPLSSLAVHWLVTLSNMHQSNLSRPFLALVQQPQTMAVSVYTIKSLLHLCISLVIMSLQSVFIEFLVEVHVHVC